MNKRLLKEVRLLLPAFIVTILLSILPEILWRLQAREFASLMNSYAPVFFAGGCAFMGCTLFGSEFQYRTMPLLLAQPISRKVLWREKLLVLGSAIAICLVTVLFLSQTTILFLSQEQTDSDYHLLPTGFFVLIAFAIFCTTPYSALVFRNIFGSVTSSAAVPFIIFLFSETLHSPLAIAAYTIAFVLYSILFYFLGYKVFLRLELLSGDEQAEINLPHSLETALTHRPGKWFPQFSSPFATLLGKEIRLQKTTFIVAGSFLLLNFIGACLHPFKPELAKSIIGTAFAFNLFLIPMIAGTVSFTEERGWGIADWHRTLPSPLWKQWTAKLLVNCSLSLGLGLVLPLIIYLAGHKLLNPDGFSALSVLSGFGNLGVLFLLYLLIIVPIYIASFSTRTVHAIIISVVVVIVTFVSMIGLQALIESNQIFRMSIETLTIPGFLMQKADMNAFFFPAFEAGLLVCLLLAFTYYNFKQSKTPIRMLIYQSVTLYSIYSLILLTCLNIHQATPPPIEKPYIDTHHRRSPVIYPGIN